MRQHKATIPKGERTLGAEGVVLGGDGALCEHVEQGGLAAPLARCSRNLIPNVGETNNSHLQRGAEAAEQHDIIVFFCVLLGGHFGCEP